MPSAQSPVLPHRIDTPDASWSKTYKPILLLILVVGLLPGCLLRQTRDARREPGITLTVTGVDSAWNESRGAPGVALSKSGSGWTVQAKVGDVLAVSFPDAKDAEVFPGLLALSQEEAGLYYPIFEKHPTEMAFEHDTFRATLNGQLVGVDLSQEAGLEWLKKASPEALERLRFVFLGDLNPDQQALISRLEGERLVVCVANYAQVAGLMEKLNPYGLVIRETEPSLKSLEPFASLEELRLLNLRNLDEVRDLTPLAELRHLRSLTLRDFEALEDLSALSGLKDLVSVNLSGCEQIKDLDPLAGLPALTALNFGECSLTTGVNGFAPDRLRTLWLPPGTSNAQLREVVKAQPRLETLVVNSSSELTDLTPLASLTRLTALGLSDCTGIRNLEPLSSLNTLNLLLISPAEEVGSYAPLHGLTELRRLYIDTHERDEKELETLKAALPECEVIGFCLGSSWILALVGAALVGGLWRRRRLAPVER